MNEYEYEHLRKAYFQIYYFDVVADLLPPKAGQIAILTQTPDFGTAHILLITDGVRTIRELYEAWKNSQVTPQAIMSAVTAEQQARITADASLEQQIIALQQSANRALVFDNHADLQAWMASGQPLPPPNPPYTATDLQIGWQALFRNTGESDLWWDGTQWLEQEINIDLYGYVTSNALETILESYAPINSPVFTGIPQVTVPDYTIPLQAVPVSEFIYVLQSVRSITYGKWRTCEAMDHPARPIYRVMERNPNIVRRFENSNI